MFLLRTRGPGQPRAQQEPRSPGEWGQPLVALGSLSYTVSGLEGPGARGIQSG